MNNQSLIICRCEEVSSKKLHQVANEQRCSARELKLRTRAGMGYCGGRTCRMAINKIAAHYQATQPTDIPLKYQAPVRVVSFEQMGTGGELK